MRTYKTEGIIIKRFNVGEADRLLTVFTKEDGKFTVRAKGIRRVPSRRSAHVELLNKTTLTLYKGKGMPTLVEANSLESFREIKENLVKIGFAYHICELINGLCPENQEHSAIYELLYETLGSLQKIEEENIAEVIHTFEIALLTDLGYWKKDEVLARRLNTTSYIENILERRLKSRFIFGKLD